MLDRLTVREKIALLLFILLLTSAVNIGSVYLYEREVNALENSATVAGDQQVRAQEMAQLSQRLSADSESPGIRPQLNTTIARYERSLLALENGEAIGGTSLADPPPDVATELRANDELWQEYKAHINTISEQEPVNLEFRESRRNIETNQKDIDAAIDSVGLAYETSDGEYTEEREAVRRLKILNAQITSQTATIATNEDPGETSLRVEGSKNLLESRVDEFDTLMTALQTGGEYQGTNFTKPSPSAAAELERLSDEWEPQQESALVIARQSKYNAEFVTSIRFVQNNTQDLVDRSQRVADGFADESATRRSFLQQLLVGLFGVNAIVFIIGVYFSNRFIGRPIGRLTETANSIASGEVSGDMADASTDPSETPRDEITRLTESFSEMHSTLDTVTRQADALASQRFDDKVLDENVPGKFGDSLQRMQENITRLIEDQRATASELKAKNDQLQRNQDLLDKTQKIADVGGWELDVQSQDMVWTGQSYEIFGLAPDQEPTVEWILETGLDSETADDVDEAVERAITTGDSFTIEGRLNPDHTETRWIRVSGAPVYDEDDDRVVQIRGAVQDITARKRREQELEQYETLVETAGNPMWFIGPNGTIEVVNDAMVSLIGTSKDDVLGSNVRDVMPNELADSGEETIRELLSADDKQMETHLWQMEEEQGDERLFEVVVSVLTDDNTGEFLGTVGIFRDITDQERYRRELERQNERLDQFASIISHDLRNPLGIARTYLDFARETGDEKDFNAIEDSLERMESMITDLLQFARSGSIDETESVNLAMIAHEAWGHIDDENASLSVDVADVHVQADAGKLMNVFENLFRNSIEHTESGVTVTVGTLSDTDGFYIADDGSGIPQEKREQIFNHGYTESEEGTGFGLSIVSTIADAHGWDINVTDSDDGGARFEFTSVEVMTASSSDTRER